MSDRWLEPWLDDLHAAAGSAPVLEIGCGSARDSLTLLSGGMRVIGIDLDDGEVARGRERVAAYGDRAKLYCQDLRAAFPAGSSESGAIIASLSLHYFSWAETSAIVARLRATLVDGGLFIVRLNATDDFNFGARRAEDRGDIIEPDYYLVGGHPKRFFDRSAVEKLFGTGWTTVSLEHRTIDRYEAPKRVWEVVLRKTAAA